MGTPYQHFRHTKPIPESLKNTALFNGLSVEDLTSVVPLTRRVRIRAGQILFRQFEPCSAFFLVVHGVIKLYCMGPNGREKAIAFMTSGQTFAEAAMFSGVGYPVNALAMEDGELIAIDAYRFTRYMRSRPEVTWKILATLSQHLHRLVNQIDSLSTHNAQQKVAAYLLDHFDPEDGDGWVEGLPSRRVDLADILGIQPETLSRILRDFTQRGWIEKTGNDIRLLDSEALVRILGMAAAAPCSISTLKS
jgi:CRP-like cAMP-binding protein